MSSRPASTRSADLGDVEYRTPIRNRIGDTVLLLLTAPIGGGALVFLLMIPAVLLSVVVRRSGLGEPSDASVVWIAGALAAVTLGVAAFFIRPWIAWRIRLEPAQVVLGGLGWPRRIRYEDLEFIWANPESADQTRDRVRGFGVKGVVSLRVSTGRRHRRIMLNCEEAQLCLGELQRRSPRAAAIDIYGRDYLPSDADARTTARRRLARYWLASGTVSLLLGVGGGVAANARLTGGWPAATGLNTAVEELRDRSNALYFLSFTPVFVGWGLFCLRQGRKHLRELSR